MSINKIRKKRRRLVYQLTAKNGAGFKVYLIPKEKRPYGVDGIELMWISTREIRKEKRIKISWHSLRIKDWEAIAIMEGLTRALIVKKLGKQTILLRGKKWKN